MRSLLRSLPALVLLAAVVGCNSDKRAPVSGKVTVAGKGPLTGGNIRFISVADPNRSGGGQIKSDGSYEVADAPVGECKVVIDNTHLDTTPKKGAGMMPGAPGAPMAGGPGISAPKAPGGLTEKDKANMKAGPKGIEFSAEMSAGKSDVSSHKYIKIDPSYAKDDGTPLKADVKPQPNTIDFDVK